MNDFNKRLLERAKEFGFTDAEVYFSNSKAFEVMSRENEIENYVNSATRGISFRGTYNGKMGYSYSERLDEDAIDIILNEAKQNSEILEEKEQDKLFSGSDIYADINCYSDELANVSVQSKINAAFEMETAAKGASTEIAAVDYSMVEYGETEISILNTMGLDLKHKSNHSVAYVSARAVRGDDTKTGDEYWIGAEWVGFTPERLGQSASESAVSKFGAKPVESRQYKILFRNTVFANLLDRFSGIFLADNVQKGFSLFEGKLGTEVASANLTVIDDPLYEGGQNSSSFDAEGVATYTKAVIDKGILCTFLYNMKTAEKDGVKSTGNASKYSFRSPVKVAPSNLYVAPSDTSFEQLASDIGDGIYITELSGLHSGANEISGDFSLLSQGFIIEGGKITTPVEQITIAGNFFELLKEVVSVGSDLRFTMDAVGSPSIYVKSLAVAGL